MVPSALAMLVSGVLQPLGPAGIMPYAWQVPLKGLSAEEGCPSPVPGDNGWEPSRGPWIALLTHPFSG